MKKILQGVTPKQHRVYMYIDDYIHAHGYAPSFEEISKSLKIRSKGEVSKIIDALVKKGFVQKESYKARSVFPIYIATESGAMINHDN